MPKLNVGNETMGQRKRKNYFVRREPTAQRTTKLFAMGAKKRFYTFSLCVFLLHKIRTVFHRWFKFFFWFGSRFFVHSFVFRIWKFVFSVHVVPQKFIRNAKLNMRFFFLRWRWKIHTRVARIRDRPMWTKNEDNRIMDELRKKISETKNRRRKWMDTKETNEFCVEIRRSE